MEKKNFPNECLHAKHFKIKLASDKKEKQLMTNLFKGEVC